MFFKRNEDINIKIISTHKKKGVFNQSTFHNLDRNRILLVTSSPCHTKMILQVFSSKDLSNCLAERIIESPGQPWIFNGENSNGTILLKNYNSELGTLNLLKIDESLTTISMHVLRPGKVCIIDDNHFFVSREVDNGYSFQLYNWSHAACVELEEISLPFRLEEAGDYFLEHPQSLGGNRFSVLVESVTHGNSSILIFDLDLNARSVIIVGEIQPRIKFGCSSPSSASYVVLPNNQLLTYHRRHDGIQIWDTKSLQCIRDFDLRVACPSVRFLFSFIDVLNVIALNDSVHVLVVTNGNMYVLNTQTLMISSKAATVDPYGHHLVLGNGDLIIFPNQLHLNTHITLNHCEMPKIRQYQQQAFFQTQHTARLSMYRNGLPLELINNIIRMTYTQHELSVGTQELIEEKPSCCVTM